MTDKQPEPRTILLVHFEETSFGDPHYAHVVAQVVKETWDENAHTRPYQYTTWAGSLNVDGLEVSCQMDNGGNHDSPLPYGYGIRYRERSYIDMDGAKAMFTTLGYISSYLARLEKEWGRVRTYGQYLLRVARAVKADAIWVLRPEYSTRKGNQPNRYEVMSKATDDVDDWIVWKSKDWFGNPWCARND